MRYSIPDTGDLNAAYWNGVNQWNDLTSEVDSFLVSNSSVVNNNNDKNEVFLTTREEIDGNNGVALRRYGTCFVGSNDIDEVDIAIANDMEYGNPSPVAMGNQGRGTFAHEFGHLFGFDEDNGQWAVMHQTSRAYTGGSQTASVFPSDTAGLNALYGLNSSASNLLPSAHNVDGTTTILLETGTASVCRGASSAIRFYLGNSGSGNSGTYNLRIRLTTDSGGSGGAAVAAFTHSLNAFSQGVYSLPFTVPTWFGTGTYYIFVDMDYTSSISEVREWDNSTRSGQLLSVTAC